ncbi:hypothetical protein Leryth_022400 [Lithospermum erythrorhizon]|uniref:Pectinesterase n=1 Tax=Lithospermum erythrorhizon TaxID=34254 RepID=A0AAV3RW40_LITER|nr:hypothetical protein Leryth_022400 [Lithospermum erythrorhizon]
MGVAKKVSITVVSLILVVGAVIGIVAIVKHTGNGSISASQKTVEAICAPTQNQESCKQSLQSVFEKKDASIQDYLEAAVKSTIDEVRKAATATSKVEIKKDDDPYNDQKGVEDCKNLLDETVEQLDAAISAVGSSDLSTIQKRTEEFIAWLTGAYIYQQTCVDEVEKPEYKSAVQDNMVNSKQLTENALYIFAKIQDVLKMLQIPTEITNFVGNATSKISDNFSRRLLQDGVVGHDIEDIGFPTWVQSSDRKLLGGPGVQPDAVVALDGSGKFKKISDAINSVPKKNTKRFVVYIKAGTYKEVVQIKKKDNVFLIGDGIGKTIITGDLSFKKGVKTSATATVAVDSNFFMARGITFENSAGPDGHQAVALRINGEKAVIFECEMRAYQDTLYYHKGLQFYKNCIISGTVDFIFGNGRAIIQDSTIVARKPGPNQSNMLTADGGLSPVGQHGLVIQNCRIVAEPQLLATKAQTKTYLGRPWKEYAVTVFMQSDIGDFIFPAGYSIFTNVGPGSTNQNTAIYAEYANSGPGSNTNQRDRATFKKFKLLAPKEAEGFTVGRFIDGPAWLPASGVPFKVGL